MTFTKGIEVGNTFKLGTKYAESLGLQYLDRDNQLKPVVMGSYGIGLERCMAAIAEQHNDENGLIWPMAVAPFAVAIVVVSTKNEEQMRVANELYERLAHEHIDVLLDDRSERPGVKFKDMDLIGIPYRITVGRGAASGMVEWCVREDQTMEEVTTEEAFTKAMTLQKNV